MNLRDSQGNAGTQLLSVGTIYIPVADEPYFHVRTSEIPKRKIFIQDAADIR